MTRSLVSGHKFRIRTLQLSISVTQGLGVAQSPWSPKRQRQRQRETGRERERKQTIETRPLLMLALITWLRCLSHISTDSDSFIPPLSTGMSGRTIEGKEFL